MPRLTRRDSQETYDLPRGVTVIGRSSDSHIQVLGRPVSRTHCKVEGPAGGWTLTDCGSKLGTYVNGRRVQRHRLQQGDEIKVGPAVFVFAEDEPSGGAGDAEAEAPAAARARRPVLPLVLLTLGVVVALAAVGGLIALGVSTRRTPRQVVRQAAGLLAARDAEALWALVSRERQREMTFEEFQEQVALAPEEGLGALETLEVGDERRAEVGVVVPIALVVGGERVADEVVLYREDGAWRIHTAPVQRLRALLR
jgi:pSer/pThr/pTyr-binding forkhead associated (FHA) protein